MYRFGHKRVESSPSKHRLLALLRCDADYAVMMSVIHTHGARSQYSIATVKELEQQIHAWQEQRNAAATTINWRFTTANARIKLKRLYPSLETQDPSLQQDNVAEEV
jgi:hypothetical protein